MPEYITDVSDGKGGVIAKPIEKDAADQGVIRITCGAVAWATGTAYTREDPEISYVEYEGSYYECLRDHTSPATFEETPAGTWQKLQEFDSATKRQVAQSLWLRKGRVIASVDEVICNAATTGGNTADIVPITGTGADLTAATSIVAAGQSAGRAIDIPIAGGTQADPAVVYDVQVTLTDDGSPPHIKRFSFQLTIVDR